MGLYKGKTGSRTGVATLLVYGLFIHGLRQRNLWMIAGLIVAVPGVLKAGREVAAPETP